MKNKIMVLALLVLLVLPLATAQDPSFIFKRDTNSNITITCINSNNEFCSAGAVCTLTVFKPDNTLLFNDVAMTNNNNFHIFPIFANESQTLGEHSAVVQCDEPGPPSEDLFESFTFLITQSGADRINPGEGISLLIAFGIIFIVSIFFLVLSSRTNDQSMKAIFIGLSVFFLFADILYTITIISENLSQFENLIRGFGAFVITLLAFFGFGTIVVMVFIKALKSWRIKKGIFQQGDIV